MVLLTKDLYFKYFKRVPVEKSVSAWSSSCPGFPVFPPEVTLSLSRDWFDALGLRRWSLGWCFETFWMELLLVLSKATSKHPDASRIQQFLLAFIISILEIWEVFRLQFPKRPAIYNAPQDTVTEAWLHDINDFSCSHILCICILYRASLDSSVHSWFSRDSAESHHVQEVRGDDMKDVQELPLEEVMFVCKAGQKPWIFVNPSLDNIAPTYQICEKKSFSTCFHSLWQLWTWWMLQYNLVRTMEVCTVGEACGSKHFAYTFLLFLSGNQWECQPQLLALTVCCFGFFAPLHWPRYLPFFVNMRLRSNERALVDTVDTFWTAFMAFILVWKRWKCLQ